MKTKEYLFLAILIICAVAILGVRVLGDISDEMRALEVSSLSGLKSILVLPLWEMNLPFVEFQGSLEEKEQQWERATQHFVKMEPYIPIKLMQQVTSTVQKAGLQIIIGEITGQEPTLWVKISVRKVCESSTTYCAFTVSVSFSQEVELTRDDKIRVQATTWPMFPPPPKIITVERARLYEALQEEVSNRVNEFINDYLAANPKAAGLSLSPFKDKTTWVKCRNPECSAEYEMNLKAYFEFIEENIDPETLAAPPMTCKKCGEPSVYRAVKCGACGKVFEMGSIPRDFADRCPKCGYSQIEKDRKRKATRQ